MGMEYRVKAEYLGGNPDFNLDKDEQKGIECEGYLLATFTKEDDKNTKVGSAIHNLTIEQIAKWLERSDDEMKYDILEAALIAYGHIQARRLHTENLKRNMMCDLFEGIKPRLHEEDDD